MPAVVFINEWLPNPAGVDKNGEFVELYNGGSAAVVLDGWTLKADGKKRFSLDGLGIPARGDLLLAHRETGLSLRNEDGSLALFDARGLRVDAAGFAGAAPAGKSYSRANYSAADIRHFSFQNPTPGAPNGSVRTAIVARAYPQGVPLNRSLDTSGFFAIMMGTVALLAGLAVYVIKSHEDLSQLFFGSDEKTW